MTDLSCKKCQSTSYVKLEHIRGQQRYLCKGCGCQFTNTAPRGVNPALKAFSVVLYSHCGVSMGNLAKLFKISIVARYARLRLRFRTHQSQKQKSLWVMKCGIL